MHTVMVHVFVFLAWLNIYTVRNIPVCLLHPPSSNKTLWPGNTLAVSGEQSQCEQCCGKPTDLCSNVEKHCAVWNLHTQTRVTVGPDLGTGQHMAQSQGPTRWVMCTGWGGGGAVSKTKTHTGVRPCQQHPNTLARICCCIHVGKDTFSRYAACGVKWCYQQELHTPVNHHSNG